MTPEVPPLRPWLFRIAHNAALDFLKSHGQKHTEARAELDDVAGFDDRRPIRRSCARRSRASSLCPVSQRSAVILKDVLGHSLEETAETMGTTVMAVKAALVRGRGKLAEAGAGTPARGRASYARSSIATRRSSTHATGTECARSWRRLPARPGLEVPAPRQGSRHRTSAATRRRTCRCASSASRAARARGVRRRGVQAGVLHPARVGRRPGELDPRLPLRPVRRARGALRAGVRRERSATSPATASLASTRCAGRLRLGSCRGRRGIATASGRRWPADRSGSPSPPGRGNPRRSLA